MKVIVAPRRSGKTITLIQFANNKDGYIVCASVMEAHRIMDTAKYMGYDINLPITYYEFIKGEYYDKGVDKFFIDNGDELIQCLSRVPIAAITINDEVI